jgi:branched-chain amino acid transport system substrate-binding protein
VFLADVTQIGEILGRRVELVERDDQAKPEIDVAMDKELIEKEKVVAVVGFGNTGVALQAAKVFQKAKIPLIVTGATGVPVTKSAMPPAYPASYVFRTGTTDGLQPIVILNDLMDRRKIDKIALLHDESPFGQFAKQNVLAELQRRGIKPAQMESFKVGDADVDTQLQHI